VKFAAIDIGSNAVRLLISNVYDGINGSSFKKSSLIRLPIRLGEDVFVNGKISEKKELRLTKAMSAFKNMIDIHEVISFRACATSAMREASNGKEVAERIFESTGVNIEIVSGTAEAEIIYANHIAEDLDNKFDYLYIDVGGGSTELTLFSNGYIKASRSFNIGTIRLLHNKVEKWQWDEMKTWIKQHVISNKPIQAIGSGGNINKLYKLAKIKEGKPLSFEKLKELEVILNKYSYEERMELIGLNPDRADVIVPASKIYLTAMKQADSKKIYVPQIGMSDGLVHLQYEAYKKHLK
jgi:exopolyphosphatase / guanosine-5'-triphosphate,3'-diphosphate pyrophosphatase